MSKKLGKTVREYIKGVSDEKWITMVIGFHRALNKFPESDEKAILSSLLKMDGADFYELALEIENYFGV